MGKHDVRNIVLGGGILLGLYFLFGGSFKWPGGNGGNGTPPPSGTYKCPYCGQIFNTYQELLDHLNSGVHPPPEVVPIPGIYPMASIVYGNVYGDPPTYYRYGVYKGWNILFWAPPSMKEPTPDPLGHSQMNVEYAIYWYGYKIIGNYQSASYYNTNTLGELYNYIDTYGA